MHPTFDAAGYLLDLDGTLISGGRALPEARWLLERVRGRFMLVSDDAEHTPPQLSRMLHAMGLPIGPERIVLAGVAAVDFVAREHRGAAVMVLGSAALRAHARRKGLRLAAERADVVLVLRDRGFTYAKLAAAAAAVSAGAAFVAACPDTSHPGPDGRPVPETGALAAAIAAAGGRPPHAVIGKPEPALFRLACERLGVAPARGVMIGDNPETDGLGAERLGMRFLHVARGRLGDVLPRERLAAGEAAHA